MHGIARAVLAYCLTIAPLAAEPVRVATFNAALSRSGPGLLVQGLLKGGDPQVASVVSLLAEVRPDIILITEFDYDFNGVAAGLFSDLLRERGLNLPYHFAGPVNAGVPSGYDLNGDGRLAGRGDAFGYGRFPGQEGMLLMSAFPIDTAEVRSFQELLWSALPGAELPRRRDGSQFPSSEAQDIMRLSSKSHWDVPIRLPDGTRLSIYASHPTPPVFDGPEDRNGRRNHDEIAFWLRYLDGVAFPDDAGLDAAMSGGPFVILGDLNADPNDGDGRRDAIAELLTHPRVQDAKPGSDGAIEASILQKGVNRTHSGPAELDTADWNDFRGPGNMRVDFVLPSRDLRVVGAGVFWPKLADPLRSLIEPRGDRWTNHRLVWVDIDF